MDEQKADKTVLKQSSINWVLSTYKWSL